MDLAQYRARVLDSYALVTYLPNPLGDFFDSLSRSLVPDCKPRSHITVLPPRHLQGSLEQAKVCLEQNVSRIHPFEIQITTIEVFDITSVIYADVGQGRDRLVGIHHELNVDGLHHHERFEYHPHVTLVIDAAAEELPQLADEARQRWDAYPYSRRFTVECLHFVHNTGWNQWEELGTYDLNPVVQARR